MARLGTRPQPALPDMAYSRTQSLSHRPLWTAEAADRAASNAVQRTRLRRVLPWAAAGWWLVTVLGQLLFAVYVVGFYGRNLLQGTPEQWNQVLPNGYVTDGTFLNFVLGLHLLFAIGIMVGGSVQLLPALRRRWPQLHRWNGRAYVLTAGFMSVGGLLLIWLRGGAGDLTQHLGISLNAILILLFAALAWRNARLKRFDQHRRWALRLFLAVSGVWFFRVGLMAWLVLNQGPVGFDPESFTGPFLSVLSFAQSLLPLAVLELYFLAQRSGRAAAVLAMAGGLLLLTGLQAIGTGAAALLMWLPRL